MTDKQTNTVKTGIMEKIKKALDKPLVEICLLFMTVLIASIFLLSNAVFDGLGLLHIIFHDYRVNQYSLSLLYQLADVLFYLLLGLLLYGSICSSFFFLAQSYTKVIRAQIHKIQKLKEEQNK